MRKGSRKNLRDVLAVMVMAASLLLCGFNSSATGEAEQTAVAAAAGQQIEAPPADGTDSAATEVKQPGDVVDSLGQMIPVYGISDPSLTFPESSGEKNVRCEVELDTEGRVIKLTRRILTGAYSDFASQYTWDYDEEGRFSGFSANITVINQMKGYFRYYEDGSRDYILESFTDMCWWTATCHYNADGVLLGMEGRDLSQGIRCRRIRYVPVDEIKPDTAPGRSYQSIAPDGKVMEGSNYIFFSFLPHMAEGAPGIDLRVDQEAKKIIDAIWPGTDKELSSRESTEAEVMDDKPEEELFPVKDSLGQYVDTFGWDFTEAPARWGICAVTDIQSDERGNITDVTQYFPDDPGAGTAHMSFHYDEMNRFTEISLDLLNSELQDVYGFPAVAKWTFAYEEDGREICNFDIDTYWMSRHGSATYDAEGKELEKALTESKDNHFLYSRFNDAVNRPRES